LQQVAVVVAVVMTVIPSPLCVAHTAHLLAAKRRVAASFLHLKSLLAMTHVFALSHQMAAQPPRAIAEGGKLLQLAAASCAQYLDYEILRQTLR
jgi:hypothetical protein